MEEIFFSVNNEVNLDLWIHNTCSTVHDFKFYFILCFFVFFLEPAKQCLSIFSFHCMEKSSKNIEFLPLCSRMNTTVYEYGKA